MGDEPKGQRTPQRVGYPVWLPRLPHIAYRCVIKQNLEPLDEWFWEEASAMKKGWELFVCILIILGLGVYHYWPKTAIVGPQPTPLVVTNTVFRPVKHFKITAIQYVPTDLEFSNVPPFRIVAEVNELVYSFPNREMFYFGLGTNRQFAQGDALLPATGTYKIQFSATMFPDFNRKGMLQLYNAIQSASFYDQSNLPFSSIPGTIDSFLGLQTPTVCGTNEISISPPYSGSNRRFTGNLRIFYEISDE